MIVRIYMIMHIIAVFMISYVIHNWELILFCFYYILVIISLLDETDDIFEELDDEKVQYQLLAFIILLVMCIVKYYLDSWLFLITLCSVFKM